MWREGRAMADRDALQLANMFGAPVVKDIAIG
jgi:hypothetical protein